MESSEDELVERQAALVPDVLVDEQLMAAEKASACMTWVNLKGTFSASYRLGWP